MFETILVPLDGSKNAEKVLPYVIDYASRLNSKIILTHVCDPHNLADEWRSYLEDIASEIRLKMQEHLSKQQVNVETSILHGDPAIEILKYAEEIGSDLIMVTDRGISGQGNWPIGSVATKLLMASESPVMLIRTTPLNTIENH